jgi:lipoate-protein ligase A
VPGPRLKAGFPRRSTPSSPTVKLNELHHWRDEVFRTAAENMALDEALFAWSSRSGIAVARFYHWDHEAVTVGYFRGDTPDPPVGAVRRFTGGGLVEHGRDLTFVLTLPAACAASLATAVDRYRWIHEALAGALGECGFPVTLVRPDTPNEPGPCFLQPVPWDLIDPASGKKIAGGAQRRSRGAIIHQGSLRLPEAMRHPESPWIEGFLARLSGFAPALEKDICNRLRGEIASRVQSRYGTADWNVPD